MRQGASMVQNDNNLSYSLAHARKLSSHAACRLSALSDWIKEFKEKVKEEKTVSPQQSLQGEKQHFRW